MSKEYSLKQCKLQNGNTHTVSYIPEKYAIVGETLKLKNNDVWTDGWVVISVSDGIISSKDVPDVSTAHKRHRRTTDI